MNSSRRNFLKLSLGAAQLALLESMGLPLIRSSHANPSAPGTQTGPTKLLTIYLPGGWVPWYLWCPFTSDQIAASMPPLVSYTNERVYFNPDEVENLDGTGDAPAANGGSRIRGPALWNQAALDMGVNDFTAVGSHLGYSWRHFNLADNCAIVHGIDQGTLTHQSARVSAFSGVPGTTFKSPALHAWVAYAMHQVYGENRPLGSVVLGTAPSPLSVHLPAFASPTRITSENSLRYTMSENSHLDEWPPVNVENAWEGLRNRQDRPEFDYWGGDAGSSIGTNSMDEVMLQRARAMAGTTNYATDIFLERMYDTYRNVSHQMAKDVVSVLQNTAGQEHYLTAPSYVPMATNSPFYKSVLGGCLCSMDPGDNIGQTFDLALKLLKSDLTSAVNLEVSKILNVFHLDHHGKPREHFVWLRVFHEIVGRFLAEMKATPIGGGRTLLDDTLVLVMSEFGRTWPTHGCDHWAATSVCFANNSIVPNQMLGGYDFENRPPEASGCMGLPVDLVDETGTQINRPPRSGDVLTTTLDLMGINEGVFIPGAPGVLNGLKAE